jgi:hypothetical protein
VASQTLSLVIPPTQSSDVHSVQSKNPKANKQLDGKKKRRNKKGKGDKKDKLCIFISHGSVVYLIDNHDLFHLEHGYARIREKTIILQMAPPEL